VSESSMKQKPLLKPLLKCRWPATNHKLSKTEESFGN